MAFGPGALEGVVSAAFGNFYRGKRVLVTGHTGFKGAWLSLWLRQLGAEVWGFGLKPPTHPNLYEVIRPGTFAGERFADIRDLNKTRSALARIAPDVVFHLAAQPLVRRSYVQPIETFATNVQGTVHLLEAVRRIALGCTVIVVTSDKCYENHGGRRSYRESDALGGYDVYSASKSAAELAVQSWRKSFFEPHPGLGRIATARAGNVIGGGDYAEDRLVPDCIRALLRHRPIPIRHPAATRPWQHVLDCLSGYLWLGALLARAPKNSPLAGAFNFGPRGQAQLPVRYLVQELLRLWPGQWRHAGATNAPHEAARLDLSVAKAARLLRWFPTWKFTEAIQHTVAWYHQRHVVRSPDLRRFSLEQIAAFTRAARSKRLPWAQSAAP